MTEAVDFSKLPELTDEEREAVILEARKQKLARQEQEEYCRQYWEKLTTQKFARKYTAEELRNKLLRTKGATGKWFTINEGNRAQINALCLYFSNDPRLEKYEFSHSKGILLMGGLGVGKTHLMSFFSQNQRASYVVAPCRHIEDKWVNTNMKEEQPANWIEYYSRMITGSINSNPYGHQELGVCFDDLGKETIPSKRFGEEKNVMAEIILARYERKIDLQLTHFTTNWNAEKLTDLYGDAVTSRLKETCNIIVFSNDATSWRT